MIDLLALSLSNSFTRAGAIAAFAGLVGIALLSLLVFSQAREIKRLRDWAGRAPERAAERDQRISAETAASATRGAQPPLAARPVPRATPLVSAPVSSAVASAATAATAAPTPTGAAPATTAGPASPGAQADQAPAAPEANGSASPPGEQQAEALEASSNQDEPAGEPAREPAGETAGETAQEPTPAPSTSAARAAAPGRSPFPPSPTVPAPAAPRPPVLSSARPNAAGPSTSAARATAAPRPRGLAAQVGGEGPKYYKRERKSTRAIALIAGGVVVVVLLALLLTGSKGKGAHTAGATRGSQAQANTGAASGAAGSASSSSTTTSPESVAVTVLNGTSTAGLAHHLAADLQQSGYSQASASAGVPPGSHPKTVVEYAGGHHADAARVARALAVADVQPMEGDVGSLAGSASVVVLAGADQAALLGGAGTRSKGEPAVAGQPSSTAGQ